MALRVKGQLVSLLLLLQLAATVTEQQMRGSAEIDMARLDESFEWDENPPSCILGLQGQSVDSTHPGHHIA